MVGAAEQHSWLRSGFKSSLAWHAFANTQTGATVSDMRLQTLGPFGN